MIEKATVRLTDKSTFRLTGDTPCNELNPKALMLCAAAECAGYTVLHILGKEHIAPRRLEIGVSGELSTPTLEAGSVFTSFDFAYNVECGTLDDQAKVSRAVNLAHDKYCGLVAMLRKIAPVAHEIAIVSSEPETSGNTSSPATAAAETETGTGMRTETRTGTETGTGTGTTAAPDRETEKVY